MKLLTNETVDLEQTNTHDKGTEGWFFQSRKYKIQLNVKSIEVSRPVEQFLNRLRNEVGKETLLSEGWTAEKDSKLPPPIRARERKKHGGRKNWRHQMNYFTK